MTNSEAGSERNTHECQIHSLSSIAFKLLRIYTVGGKANAFTFCAVIYRTLKNSSHFILKSESSLKG